MNEIMMSDEIIPLKALIKAMHYWWFVVVVTIAGAVVGWGLHILHPPLYEARASFSISIDFVHTGRLSDIEQDQVLGIVGDIISSPEVIEQVIRQASNEGMLIDISTFKTASFFERKFYVWTLRIRHENPNTAARLSEIWLDAAEVALNTAMHHAIIADALQQQTAALIGCSEIVVYEPSPAFCNIENLQVIQERVEQIGEQISKEQLESKGLLSGVSYVISEIPEIPPKPVAYGQNQFMLVGSFLGFILSWLGLSFDLPDRLLRYLKRA